VVALVLAVLVIFFPLAGLLGIIAAILGFVGMRRASRNEADNRNHAVAGLVCGLLALVLSITFTVRLTDFIIDHQGDFRRFWSCITNAPTENQQRDCGAELGRALE
jgi:O-antigen/teichoic acid export membrane protein